MFNKKSSKRLNNKVSISLAFGAGMLLLAGCTSTATAPDNTPTQAQTVTAKKEDSTTARYAVNMFNNFIAPMIFQYGFTKEEYACFSEVENDFAEQQVQQVIQQYIPIEKQQEFNQFFASETAKKAAAFYAKTGELLLEARENKDIDMDAELEAYTESLNLTEQELQNFQAFVAKNKGVLNSNDNEMDNLMNKLMVSVLNKKVEACHAKGELTSYSIEEYYEYLGNQGLR
ncbi:hypothetical protein [Psychrobacter sp. I-STPA6b]|uniref:hypothetical protein n=1 Tax=Psychrobacter sp. I-STPA6b TaxID=2585718 RepID=UPI001D0C6E4D|nr:hypothetical protein [Psychrobacter sp. I-STPA6b]